MSIDQKLIDRINELARKKKSVGLNEEEAAEQVALRQEYIKQFRAGFEQQLTSIKVVDEEGNDITPEKIKAKKRLN